MRLEYVRATFLPFRANDEEYKETKSRLDSLKLSSGVNVFHADERVSTLEAKSGVLLTHITMMIAVTGLMLAISSKPMWYEVLLTLELVTYLILALGSIRCQYQIDKVDHQHLKSAGNQRDIHNYQRVLMGELIYREWLFRLTHRSLFALTFVLIGTVVVGILADDIGLLSGEIK